MKYSRSNIVLQKSIEAAKAAIELYNKPEFPYRNESFSILMINAWELLLKAKKLKENHNKMTSIYVKEKIKNKKGTITNREMYRKAMLLADTLTCKIEAQDELDKNKEKGRLTPLYVQSDESDNEDENYEI